MEARTSGAKYIDTNYIIGSVAAVEMICSIAELIDFDNRKLMKPIVFESIMFLCINRSVLNIDTVRRAMPGNNITRVAEEVMEDEYFD